MMTERRKRELQDLALFVVRIEAEQVDYPGYAQDELMSIVNAELRRFERQTGESLDRIAARAPEER